MKPTRAAPIGAHEGHAGEGQGGGGGDHGQHVRIVLHVMRQSVVTMTCVSFL